MPPQSTASVTRLRAAACCCNSVGVQRQPRFGCPSQAHLQATEARPRAACEIGERVRIGDVGPADGGALRASAGGDRAVERLDVGVGLEHQKVALGREGIGEREPDATGGRRRSAVRLQRCTRPRANEARTGARDRGLAAPLSRPDNGSMSADDRQQLVDCLRERLGARPEILEAYLFGSRAHRGPQSHSDIDVAVYIDLGRLPGSAFGYVAELTADMVSALRHDAVDVVVLNQAPPLLYHRVLRDGLRLMTRDLSATTTREGQALSRYCDYVPHLRKIDAAHAARIKDGSYGR
jgi:hypothetical protein